MIAHRKLGVLVLIGTTAILQGCSTMATGPQFAVSASPPEGKAEIYVYRPDQEYAKAAAPDLTIDGAKVGTIQNGGYMMLNVAPGQHTIDIPYNFWTWGDHCAPAIV